MSRRNGHRIQAYGDYHNRDEVIVMRETGWIFMPNHAFRIRNECGPRIPCGTPKPLPLDIEYLAKVCVLSLSTKFTNVTVRCYVHIIGQQHVFSIIKNPRYLLLLILFNIQAAFVNVHKIKWSKLKRHKSRLHYTIFIVRKVIASWNSEKGLSNPFTIVQDDPTRCGRKLFSCESFVLSPLCLKMASRKILLSFIVTQSENIRRWPFLGDSSHECDAFRLLDFRWQ